MERFSNDQDQLMAEAKEEAAKDTAEFNRKNGAVSVSFSKAACIPKNKERSFNAGYLFLQQICTRLRMENICQKTRTRHKFSYDLGAILTDLVFARILCLSSKLSSFDYCRSLLELSKYTLQNVYRALSVLAEESGFIQEELYHCSNFVHPRNDRILYYDCTNYYFETEQEDGIQRYGKSKENRPNPIVTYSPKYKAYQQKRRSRQIEQAEKIIQDPGRKRRGKNQNDPARFIKKSSVTSDGEIAEKTLYELDMERIEEESRYDGFYAVVTNLEGNVEQILKINKRRWEIEENFQIMKSEFEARPVYARREDRIKAHFLTCYISLLVYRLLEKELGPGYTCEQILQTIRGMNMTRLSKDSGYIPSYMKTDVTDTLHKSFGFRTDYEFISKASMRSIIKETKSIKKQREEI